MTYCKHCEYPIRNGRCACNDRNNLTPESARPDGAELGAAHGWAALAEYVEREMNEARAARDSAAKAGEPGAAQYWDGKQSALAELWDVFAAEMQAPPNSDSAT